MNKINIPEMSEALAELIGIHFGDGSLYKNDKSDYVIRYSCNLLKDQQFIQHINFLFNRLFQINLHTMINSNT